MKKLDLKAQFRTLYAPPSRDVVLVEVPSLSFAMIDGRIELGQSPSTSPAFQQALEALYGIAYTLKFMAKQDSASPVDFTVMALEALWWTDGGEFTLDAALPWNWTAMILQPDLVTQSMFEQAIVRLKARKDPPALARLRLERWEEGPCIQVMHIGPYAEEPATLERMRTFASKRRLRYRGRHHEIYLGDPRRARPEKLRTILRHPVEPEP